MIQNQKKKTVQITKTMAPKDYQQQHKLKWTANRRENNGIINIFTFHTTSNTSLRNRSLSVLERAIKVTGLQY